MRRSATLLLGLVVIGFAAQHPARASERVAIAAAANLIFALDALHAEFQRRAPDIAVTRTTGASGSLFAQIVNGAPFDVFLSADTDYPRQLVAARAGDPETLRVFATGRLVAWTTRRDLELSDLAALVRAPAVKRIAIAQPATAPYGRAAQAALVSLGGWDVAQPKLVVGENVSQTAQFAETGNADLAFVAMSLVVSPRLASKGVWCEVSADLHAGVSLEHAAVLTLRGAKNPAARRFLDFLGSDAARKVLRDFGYR